MKGGSLSLVFTKIKNYTRGECKIAVLKMTPEVRKVFKEGGDYAYIDLSRCRIYDRFWVTQCFHCQKFGHIFSSCPKKDDPPVCGYCSGSHNGKSCTNKDIPRCSNCASYGDTNHFAFSPSCPKFELQKQHVIENTNLSLQKN